MIDIVPHGIGLRDDDEVNRSVNSAPTRISGRSVSNSPHAAIPTRSPTHPTWRIRDCCHTPVVTLTLG